MGIFFVDVYYQYWDTMGFNPMENKLINNKQFHSDVHIDQLIDSIHHLIGTHKGDGFKIIVNSTKDVHYINILLFETKDNHTNINFLLHYFDSIAMSSDLKNEHSKNDLRPENDKYYISIPYIDMEDIKDIHEFLRSEGYKSEIVSKEIKILEKGASGFEVNVLFEIIGGISGLISIGEFIKRKFTNDYRKINLGNFDFEKIKLEISNYSGINIQDLQINKFEEVENIINIVVTSRYKDFFVKCNKDLEMIEIQILPKSQTML